jgi:hypothetical protein
MKVVIPGATKWLSAHPSRLLPTLALKVLISGKPEISGPRPGMTTAYGRRG